MEPTRIFEVFLSHENPAISGVFIIAIIVIVVIHIKRQYITPLHIENKRLKAEITKSKNL